MSRSTVTSPVLALVGPTAAGKTDVAHRVARRRLRPAPNPTTSIAPDGEHAELGDASAERSARPARNRDRCPVEIVAVDAFTVYRGMDIATAKPPGAVREEIGHHLVDVLDPWQETSVAWFQEAARTAIRGVVDRGHVPLLVGGSGLYFRAVVDDLSFPPTDRHVRAAIRRRFANDPQAAHALLEQRDPAAAAKIEPGNLRRTVRALEVIELTGRRFSSYATDWDNYTSIYPELAVRGLDRPTEQLKQRIRQRAENMVAGGLVEEARCLRSLDRPLSTTARQAIGYREAFAVLDGKLARDELPAAIARRTWRYARRQRSWFRRDPRIVWTSADEVVAAWTSTGSARGTTG